jgi:hypothetical protein
MSKPASCPKCPGVFYSFGRSPHWGLMAEHDHIHHPTRHLVINDPRGPKPRTYEFPRAEILDVKKIAYTEEGGIYAITLRAGRDESGNEMYETITDKGAE